MKRISSTMGVLCGSILLLLNCAGTKPKPAPVAAPAPEKPIELAMPQGWTDQILEKVKNNQSLKSVIAVMDFEGNDKLNGKVDLKMADMLTTALVKSGKFDVVERNKMDRVVKEQSLKMTGMIDQSSTAADVGKMLGAETVVMGVISSATEQTIDKFSYEIVRIEVAIDVRAVNTTTGKIILSEKATGVSDSKVVKTGDGTMVSGAINYNSAYAKAAQDAIELVGKKISVLFPLLGFVVQASGDQVSTDVGEARGVQKNDIFIVFRMGGEILHPATGKHLGWNKKIIGAIKVASTEENMSNGAIVRKADNAGDITVGDMVIAR
jgi:curli biogenesis system outer membrane secretion channel CsgG